MVGDAVVAAEHQGGDQAEHFLEGEEPVDGEIPRVPDDVVHPFAEFPEPGERGWLVWHAGPLRHAERSEAAGLRPFASLRVTSRSRSPFTVHRSPLTVHAVQPGITE